MLEEPDQAIEFVYFPEGGFASIVGTGKLVAQIEIGMIGREGITGLKVVLGNDRSPYQTFIQAAGTALKLDSDNLRPGHG